MVGGPQDDNGIGACWVFGNQSSQAQKLIGEDYQRNSGKIYQGKRYWFSAQYQVIVSRSPRHLHPHMVAFKFINHKSISCP